MSSPLVSICTPTYNRPEYLRRTIQSVLAQTYPNFEIIITDNSSNTDSAQMVAAMRDPRIRYYSNNGNIGACESTNRAVSFAKGKYLTLLMDDDLIKPRFMEFMVKAFEENPTVGIVMAPMDLIDLDDKRIFPKFYIFRRMEYRYRYQVGDGLIPRRQLVKDYLTRDYPCCVPSGIMYRGEALQKAGPFDPETDFGGDLDMCMRLAPYWDFYYIDQVLSSWRYAPAGHTNRIHQTGIKITVFYDVTRRCLEQPPVKEMFGKEWKKVVRDSYFFCSCRALLNGLAAVRARSPKLLWNTLKTIWREDPYVINLFRLPLFAAREILVSLFPPKIPPARE